MENSGIVPANIGSTSSQAPAVAGRPSAARNVPIDFIKGFLVLEMIVFHAVSYFARNLSPWLLYIKFVSGGFIFVSGYVVGTFYAAKWATNPPRVAARLVIRGFKLVALFTIINLTLNVLSVRNLNRVEFGLEQFMDLAFDIYVIGRGKYAAFEILLPIGYLLLLSPIILWLQRWGAVVLCALVVVSVSTLFLDWDLDNFALLLVGTVGMLLGLFLPPERIASRGHLGVSVPALLVAVAALPWLKNSLAGYILYVVVVFKCVADLSLLLPARWPARGLILLYGEYVLFCYLTQILVLQAIFRLAWPHRETPLLAVAFIVVVTGFVMLLGARIMASARLRFQFMDRAYRFVFA